MLLALLLQAAPVTSASAAPPTAFSILYRPCAPVTGKDVVVCGRDNTASNRLPLPDDAPPTPGHVKPDSGDARDNGMRDITHGRPCAVRMEGCPAVFGLQAVPLVAAARHAIADRKQAGRWAVARARDGDARQAIDVSVASPAGSLAP